MNNSSNLETTNNCYLNKIDIILATIIAGVFTMITWQYFPCVDDCIYSFSSVTGQPIKTIKDVLISNWHDYQHVNGRFLNITTCMILCSFKSIPLYSILTGCFFGVLLLSSTYLVRKLDKYHRTFNFDIIVLAICYMLLIPKWSICFGGNITCVVNYLWSATFYVGYMAILMWISKGVKCTFVKMILLLMAVIVGSWQESFSLGIAAMLIIYVYKNRKTLSNFEFLYVAIFFVGVIFSLASPGNWERMGDSGAIDSANLIIIMKSFIARFVSWLNYPIIIIVPLLALSMLPFKRGMCFLKETYYFWLPAICMILFALVVAYTGVHQLCIVGVMGSLFITIIGRTLLSNSHINLKRGGYSQSHQSCC